MLTKIMLIIAKTVLPVAVIAAALVGAREIVRAAPEPEARPDDRRAPLVNVLRVEKETVGVDVATYGTVRPRSRTQIVPQVSGIVVEVSPSLLEGAFLNDGAFLFRIDRRDYVLAVVQAEAEVERAMAVLDRENAEAAVARQEFAEFGRGTPSPLVLREPQLREAKAHLSSAQARLTRAELELERTEVKAPYECRVRSESVDIGQFLAAGAPVAEVYSTDFAEVRLSVPDDQIPFVDLPLSHSAEDGGEAGAPARKPAKVFLDAVFGGTTHRFEGAIVRTEAELDPRTRVIYAIALVEDPYARSTTGRPPLLPGMYVRATIPGRTFEDIVSLPRRALHGVDRVLTVNAEDRLEYRTIRILRSEQDRVLISGGLEAGDRVCMTELDPVVPGMKVRVDPGDDR